MLQNPLRRHSITPHVRCLLPGKDSPFARLAPAVAAEGATLAYDPVAGDKVGNGIGAHGCADGSRGGWPSDTFANALVGSGCPGRNSKQRLPNLDLKIRSHHQQIERGFRWAVERRENAGRDRSGYARLLYKLCALPVGLHLVQRVAITSVDDD